MSLVLFYNSNPDLAKLLRKEHLRLDKQDMNHQSWTETLTEFGTYGIGFTYYIR